MFLIENGLELAGFEVSPDDEEAAARGCISTQLRADWTSILMATMPRLWLFTNRAGSSATGINDDTESVLVV